jgi:hypothetical protein
MADYLGSAVAADGDSYTVNTGADFLVWIPYGYRSGTTTASGQDFGGAALTEVQDNSINLAGLGDPTINLSYKVAPVLTAQTLSLTWSGALTDENGYGISLEDVDQINPIPAVNGEDSGTYTTDNSPSLTYDAPAGATVLYYKFHCTNGASTIGTPTGFTLVANDILLTTPAYRQVSIFRKKVTADETGETVIATTSGSSPIGGCHGLVVIQSPVVLPGVNIATVGGDDVVEIGENNVIIAGTGFEAVQGTGDITISPSDNVADPLAVTISTVDSWADTSIQFDIPSAISLLYGDVYFFVTNDSAEVNASGHLASLTTPAGRQYLTIREQNDLGVLLNTTGIELDADQLEWQTLSNGGGTVYIGPSGTVYIYNYAGSVPATEEIYIRLGDDTDKTWSADALETITIGSLSATLSGVSGVYVAGNLSVETNIALTGNSGAYAVGSVTASTAIDIELTGNAGTYSVGSVDNQTQINLTGVAGAYSVGNLDNQTDISITGNAGSYAVGNVVPVGDVTIPLTGNSGTYSVGNLSPEGDQTLAVTGNVGTYQVGNVTVSTAINTPITGVTASYSVGNLENATQAQLTGVSGSYDVGSLGVAGPVTTFITGVSGSFSVGSMGVINQIDQTTRNNARTSFEARQNRESSSGARANRTSNSSVRPNRTSR